MSEPIRLLIVDDSRIFRAALAEALADQEDVQIVASVWSGSKALEVLAASPVDVVTLDVEMPGLSGLDTLRAIQQLNAAHPVQPAVGVIMVSAYTRAGARVTIEALAAGAFDFITKPRGSSVESNLQTLRQQLVAKIHQFIKHRRPRRRSHHAVLPSVPHAAPLFRRPPRAVLIAVSTGGPEALKAMLPELCRRVDLPIFIVQHMPAHFTASLAENLNQYCAHRVMEANEGDLVAPGTVYVGRGGKHLVLRSGRGKDVFTGLNDQPPENGFRPSADVLFRSAAAVYRDEVVAAVLTGMGHDGTAGVGPLKRAGAHIIVQDEATSVVWGMPGSALATGFVDEVLPLERIPEAIQALVHSRKEGAS